MRRWSWFLVGVALIVSLSCSLVGGTKAPDGESAAVTVEVAPTEKVEEDDPEPVDEADDGTLRIDEDGMEQLESYRAVITWRMEGDDGTVESFSMEQASTRSPEAQRFSMVSEGGSFEMIRIEDHMWIGSDDQWMQTSASDDDMEGFGDFLTTSDDWISDLEEGNYEYVGSETVNGFRTRHYRTENVSNWSALFGGDDDTPDEITTAVADMWIADEADLPAFVVRFALEMTGTFDGEPGTATMQQEVTEVNQPITIEAPEGAATGGLPEGVEIYPGALDVTSIGAMTMFSTGDDVTVEDVHAFYEDALTAAGWEPTDEPFAYEGMRTSTWRMGEQQLTLTITSDNEDGGAGASDGGASVIIIVEELEE